MKVVVIGETCIDKFIYCKINRLSPEAPVPILLEEQQDFSIGGAGNLAVNIQNNLLFNVFSIGMIYVIFIFGLLLFFLLKDFNQGIKVILIILSISLASFEDLLPIFGLCLGLMFTMERYEDI